MFLIQVDNTWKLCSDTDIHEEVVKRFNIPLSWLDIKRAQDPVDPGEKGIINDATSRKEKKFIPGWLNDEVTLKLGVLKTDIMGRKC